jgi:penicillin-binding protein 2
MAPGRGAVIVMELEHGGILAMNSSPSYDPNLFASTRTRRDVGKYLTDSLSPMLNRGIQGQFAPGSIFKIITGSAAFEPHKVTESTVFRCPGFYLLGKRIFRCWSEKGHGDQRWVEAFAHSCDVYFYTTGLAAGVDAIHRKATEFGFSTLTGVDLPHEKAGLVPSRAWKQKKLKAGWYDGDTLNFSIGQGYLQVTPIQALQMIAIVATDGQLLRPHLVDKIDGLQVAERHASPVEISPECLRAVKAGLDAVVNSNTGTGRLARVPGVRIAGKTGTAETGKDATHAWFVAYAPTEKPRVALVVFLEYGGHGGVEAATLAQGLFQKLKDRGHL